MPLDLKDVKVPLSDLRKNIAELQKAGAEELTLEEFLRILIAWYKPRTDTQLAFGNGIVSPLREGGDEKRL